MKIKKIVETLVFSCLLALGLSSCANVNGLHNQVAATVTFEFKNMGERVSGDYTIPGNFNDWAYKDSVISMDKGNGTSSAIVISKSNIEFTLIQTGDESWLRGWYPEVKGNGADKGTAGNPYHNFYIDGLDLGAGEIVIVIDGNTGIATPVVK